MEQKAGNVKLRLTNKTQHGQKVVLPSIGEVEVDENGILEVDDVTATLLLNQGNDYLLVEGNGTTVTADIHSEKIDPESEEVKEDTTEEDEEVDDTEETDEGTEDETKETEETTSNEEETEETAGEDETEETEEDVVDIETLKLSELIEMAEAADIPEEEYKKFRKNKKLMLNFIKNKI